MAIKRFRTTYRAYFLMHSRENMVEVSIGKRSSWRTVYSFRELDAPLFCRCNTFLQDVVRGQTKLDDGDQPTVCIYRHGKGCIQQRLLERRWVG